MRLKLFRAPAMAQAMARVRAELGEDALILATRRMGDGVEVTAALEPEEDEAPAPLPDPALLAALDYHGVSNLLRPTLRGRNLAGALSATLRFASLPLVEQPVLLVGPPGAGKTLTVARLATRLVMSGVMPLVVTADGKRAGATEQLAAFTRLLGISLVVACHPVTLARALAEREPGTPALIDTFGCNAFDPPELEELSGLAAVSQGATALVLPAGMDAAEATDIACAHAAGGATLLVVTRLDLARRLGGVLAAAAAGLALTEGGIGSGAADGLVQLSPEWLAARLVTGPRQ